MTIYESDLEEACLRWFADIGYEILESDNLDPHGVYAERESHEDVFLTGRLQAALHAINDDVPPAAVEEAVRRLLRRDAPTLEQNNFDFHRLVTEGVEVELASEEGGIRGHRVRLFDFESPSANDFVVTNQLAVVDKTTGTGQPRRPDIVLWVNGIRHPPGGDRAQEPGQCAGGCVERLQSTADLQEGHPVLVLHQ